MTDLSLDGYGADVEPPIPRRPASIVDLPLSTQQRRWWFICTSYPDAASPLVFLSHRLRGPLVVDAWLSAVGAVVDRHESLRVQLENTPAGPVQRINPPSGLAVERIDLSYLPPAEREDRARHLLNERREVRINLERDPLVASCLVRLAEDDHVWTMTIHHILADGASLAIIDRELAAFYSAFLAGGEPQLADLPIQFGDYVVWRDATPERFDPDLGYWRRQLAGVPALDLPTDAPRPAMKGAPAADVRRLVPADLALRVDELGRAERCTRFMVLLAVLQALLGHRSGQSDFCVGVPVVGIGRTRPELAPLVGLFANTLAMRCDLSADPTFRQLLADTRGTVLDAFDHLDVPFARVVAELNVAADPGRAQLLQVLFLLDEFDQKATMTLPGLRIEEFPLAVPKILHDLMVYAWPSTQGLWIRFIFDTGLFTGATVAAMARDYEYLLRHAVDHPEHRLSQLLDA